MKVPYAKKWQKETDKLRQIALDCDLTEELKWGKPCFTFVKKNVAIAIPLKESCAFSFFKGALLRDPEHVFERIGEHTQAGRWIKFTSVGEIAAVGSTLRDYLYEAIELEESGAKIELKKPSVGAVFNQRPDLFGAAIPACRSHGPAPLLRNRVLGVGLRYCHRRIASLLG